MNQNQIATTLQEELIVVTETKQKPERCELSDLFEWTMARGLLGFGLWVAFVPGSFPASRFSTALLVFDVQDIAALCITIALIRLGTLTLNGRLGIWGPRVRAASAAASAFMWLQFAIALWTPVHPSPGIPIYVMLFYSEFRSLIKARRDFNGLTNPFR